MKWIKENLVLVILMVIAVGWLPAGIVISVLCNNAACASESSENVNPISISYRTYGNTSPTIACADLNGDGFVDIAIAVTGGPDVKVFIFKNDGKGNFSLSK